MGNKYIDETILSLREYYRNDSRQLDITEGEVYLRGRWVSFNPVYLFDHTVKLFLPENFADLPETVAKVRYFCQYRPQVIMSSSDYSDNFGFHLLERKVINIDDAVKQMQDATLRHAPETVLYDSGIILAEESEGRWFEYKNFTVNDETYNMQFLVYKEQTLLVGTFNCRMCFYDEWKPLVLQVFNTITIDTGRDKRHGNG